MGKRVVWTMIGILIVSALGAVSCASPAAPSTTTAPTATPSPKQPTTVPASTRPAKNGADVPKYGGTLVLVDSNPLGFDNYYTSGVSNGTVYLTNEELLGGDWAKGPAGTNETDWSIGEGGRISLLTGMLAESYELTDPTTTIYHIRKGIRWQNKAPVNGREFTADDVVYNFQRQIFTEGALGYVKPENRLTITSAKALDKYTVEVKALPGNQGYGLISQGDSFFHFPREVIEKYGGMQDWRNACGTGPFMLTDYVSNSTITFERNPTYWKTDPLHPENQLPYLDGVKWLIIADVSTKLAAFRTGKIDQLGAISNPDKEELAGRTPELRYIETVGSYMFPNGRVDKPELPFKDIRVRQALNLAVDKEAILNEFYEGQGWLNTYPVPPSPVFKNQYVPIEQLTDKPTMKGSEVSAREMFAYNPDKAKKLLAEAGFPNGFKTNIVVKQTDVDLVSIVREYLLKVGVDMEIKPLEAGVFTSVQRSKNPEQMIFYGGSNRTPYALMQTILTNVDDVSHYTDQETLDARTAIYAALGRNEAEVDRVMREYSSHIIESAWGIWLPTEKTFSMWWPWLQNFHGEINIGKDGGHGIYSRYIWVDDQLKKSMGY